MPASALLLAASAAVRAASLNLCSDEYLLLLARPDEIASVSFLSRDPLESSLWKSARRHDANRGSIEQVVGQRPSLVLTMGGGGRSSAMIAGRLGIRTLELSSANSPDDVARNLAVVAGAIGHPARAVPLVRRLRDLQRSAPHQPADAIWLSGNGLSLASDSAGAKWLALAGLRQRALPGAKADLETLLVRPPAVIVESNYRRGQVSEATTWLSHPIVKRARSRRLKTDGRAWTCTGPLMIDEIARLKAAAR